MNSSNKSILRKKIILITYILTSCPAWSKCLATAREDIWKIKPKFSDLFQIMWKFYIKQEPKEITEKKINKKKNHKRKSGLKIQNKKIRIVSSMLVTVWQIHAAVIEWRLNYISFDTFQVASLHLYFLPMNAYILGIVHVIPA